MASPGARTTRRAAADTSNLGPLTLDGLYEVLLRLPAKELCRLRTVCRSWRSLLSDSHFVAAHAARPRPEPLFLARYAADGDSLVDVLDALGRVVKRVRRKEGEVVVTMASDLVCVKMIEGNSFHLLNPATGSVYQLPNNLAEEHRSGFKRCDYGEPVYLLGKVPSTGEDKVLRMLPYRQRDGHKDLFEVCTVDPRSPVKWRGKQRPSEPFAWNEWTRVVIGEVVYFLTVDAYFAVITPQATEKSWIISFDLEAEEWGASIKGPISLVDDERLNVYHGSWSKQITLANLNGSLVIVHGPTPYMDLWFLIDSEKGLWIKHYSMQIQQYKDILPVHPFMVLDDGRILVRCLDFLLIYDSRADTLYNVVKRSHLSGISMFTGNLLSLDRENY